MGRGGCSEFTVQIMFSGLKPHAWHDLHLQCRPQADCWTGDCGTGPCSWQKHVELTQPKTRPSLGDNPLNEGWKLRELPELDGSGCANTKKFGGFSTEQQPTFEGSDANCGRVSMQFHDSMSNTMSGSLQGMDSMVLPVNTRKTEGPAQEFLHSGEVQAQWGQTHQVPRRGEMCCELVYVGEKRGSGLTPRRESE